MLANLIVVTTLWFLCLFGKRRGKVKFNLRSIAFLLGLVSPVITVTWLVVSILVERRSKGEDRILMDSVMGPARSGEEHSVWFAIPFINWFITYRATYIGQIAIPERTAIEYDHTDEIYGAMLKDRSKGTLIGLTAAVLMLVAQLMGLGQVTLLGLALGVFMVMQAAPEGSNEIRNRPGELFKGQNGLYTIRADFLGMTKHVGVAYAEAGSLVSKYHVTGGKNIFYAGEEYEVSYAEVNGDTVAWGALPMFAQMNHGEKVMLSNYNPNDGRVTVSSGHVRIEGDEYSIAAPATLPGSSGSPFFVKREVQYGSNVKMEWVLAGSTGFRVKTPSMRNKQLEVGRIYPNLGYVAGDIVTLGTIEQMAEHTGKGKTMTAIARYVEDAKRQGFRTLVAGPTRVVAVTQRDALRDRFPDVACAIKGQRYNHRADVITTTHPTALKMLLQGEVKPKTVVIVDESHFQQATTQLLLTMLRARASETKDIALVEMSATLEDLQTGQPVLMRGSNFTITDYAVPEEDYFETLVGTIESKPWARVVVFCPSITGARGVHEMAEALKTRIDRTIHKIHSGNFNVAYNRLRREAEKGDVVLTTSISECGANYDADIVFDDGRQIGFVVLRGNKVRIVRKDGYITESQRIQRRGRVGRRREGEYYTTEEAVAGTRSVLVDEDAAELFDECLASKVLGLPMPRHGRAIAEALLKVSLTPHQVHRWLENGEDGVIETLLSTEVYYDHSGIKRSQDMIKNIMAGNLAWEDQRNVSMYQEVQIAKREKYLRAKTVNVELVEADPEDVEIRSTMYRVAGARYYRGVPRTVAVSSGYLTSTEHTLHRREDDRVP